MRPLGLASIEALARNKAHGSRVRYLGGCRCLPCRAANSNYAVMRALRIRQGLWNGFVSARTARRHVARLSRQGVGYKTVADVAGVSKSVMFKIRSGRRKQIRALTEKRILGVSRDAVRGTTNVPAAQTWQQIRWLIDEGFTQTELARRLGSKAKVPALQLNKNSVTAANAKKIEQLWRSFQ